ncbi:DNA ligase [Solimonas variicoloris]|uniref:DNA ligase n=1 Tax=Solimonas variicoloris TaxID=254408 RepID=UPI0003A4C39A|nr:DNA ligase [Solimonas variicoloris]
MLRSLLLCLALWAPVAFAAEAPALLLAKVYHDGDPIELPAYWVSEKLDGVRAYWDGARLWTRGGQPIVAPPGYTAGWPQQPLDGELWAGRGRFEAVSAAVRRYQPEARDWQPIRLMVFDLPAHPGDFDARLQALRRLLAAPPPTLRAVEQFRVASPAALRARLDAIVAAGGEGLMLHRGDSRYAAGRSGDLLKYKPYDDAEATVVGYVPGKGRYAGLVGALEVESDDGRRFRLGSGLRDAERRRPPPLGSRVTYAYNGLTEQGLPRFARFLRVRDAP